MPTELPPDLQPPSKPRHLTFHRFQWIALPLMLLIPVLALLGVFGESSDQVRDETGELSLYVDYPTRYRYKQINTVEVFVRNRTPETIDTVLVALDASYAERFSTLMFIPAATEPFEVELLDVAPQETRRVWVEIQGEHYGRHRGDLKAYRPGAVDTARVSLSTFIFP